MKTQIQKTKQGKRIIFEITNKEITNTQNTTNEIINTKIILQLIQAIKVGEQDEI